MDPQIPEDDATGRIETSAAGDGSLSEAGRNQEPYEGMLFESEEAARSFYDEYAGRIGFVTRVLSSRRSERDGSIISRGLGCRGGSDNQKSDSVATQKRDRRREGCTSMILVKRETPGRWVVRKFVRDHNHPLVGLLTKRRPTYASCPWCPPPIRHFPTNLTYQKTSKRLFKLQQSRTLGSVLNPSLNTLDLRSLCFSSYGCFWMKEIRGFRN